MLITVSKKKEKPDSIVPWYDNVWVKNTITLHTRFDAVPGPSLFFLRLFSIFAEFFYQMIRETMFLVIERRLKNDAWAKKYIEKTITISKLNSCLPWEWEWGRKCVREGEKDFVRWTICNLLQGIFLLEMYQYDVCNKRVRCSFKMHMNEHEF